MINLKKVINKCPKTFKAYKHWLIKAMIKKYPENDMSNVLTDEMLTASIVNSPYSCTYFFDQKNLVGTLNYSESEKEFQCIVNENPINVHEDHQWSKDRRKAEETLIEYLFIENEKTL